MGLEQHGYRKNMSTTDLIFSIRSLVEKSWEFNKPAYFTFIDLSKAFDSIPREMLWKCMNEEYGITGRLGRALKSMYIPCICKIRTCFENKKWFNVETGVKQGSVISPILFYRIYGQRHKKF